MGDINSTPTTWTTLVTVTNAQTTQTITSIVTGLSSTTAGTPSTTGLTETESMVTSTAGSMLGPNSTTVSKPSSSAISSGGASGVSTGATAGIAIACVVVGLVIGAIAACFFLRRRQNRRPKPEYVPTRYSTGREKSLPAATTPPSVTTSLSLDQYLLDSKPDADIVSEMRNLSILIQQHVENNYHLGPVHQSSGTLAQALMDIGIPQIGQLNCNNLAQLSVEPATRYFAIEHVISRVTFESTTIFGRSSISLLPPFVSAFAKAVPPIEQHRGSSEAFSTAVTKWRQLSAFLLHPRRSDRTPLLPSEDIGTKQAQQLAIALNAFLEPFINANHHDSLYEQENHLREVIVECTTFGYLLFSQPSEFRFKFDNDQGHNGLVIYPGLEKVTDEYGRRLSAPQRLVAPAIQDF